MSTGSKVVLLLSFLFIGVLIWYYGPASDAPIPVAEDPILAKATATVEERPAPTPLQEPERPRARSTAAIQPAASTTSSNIHSTWTVPTPPAPAITTAPQGTLVMGQPRTTPASYQFQPRPPVESVSTTASLDATVDVRPEPTMRTYVIASGDTLSGIAFTYYGTGIAWLRIAEANPDVDPDRLRVGTTLRIPPHTPRASSRSSRSTVATRPLSSHAADGKSHRVEDGESLSSIADHYYGRETRWTRIFEANRTLLQNDPDRLRIGMVLSIPGN